MRKLYKNVSIFLIASLFSFEAFSSCNEDRGTPFAEIFYQSGGLIAKYQSHQLYKNLIKVIENDLLLSSTIHISKKNQHLVKNFFAEGLLLSTETLQDTNLDYLITLNIQSLSNLKEIVYFRIYDNCTSKLILEKSLEFKFHKWRRASHIISDKIHETITGINGFFDTKIIYVKDKELGIESRRITMVDYDGVNSRNLTNNSNAVDPNFSEDSKKFVYVNLLKDEKSQIIIKNLETNVETNLDLCVGICSNPTFSPDGNNILYSDTYNETSNIRIFNTQSEKIESITNDQFINTSPSYSPDGAKISFISNKNGFKNIYIANLLQNTITRIGNKNENYTEISWSPTNEWIAFNKMSKIGIIKEDDSNELIILQKGHLKQPSWLPNGRSIVYLQSTIGSQLKYTQAKMINLYNKKIRTLSLPRNAHSIKWSNNLEYLDIRNKKNKDEETNNTDNFDDIDAQETSE